MLLEQFSIKNQSNFLVENGGLTSVILGRRVTDALRQSPGFEVEEIHFPETIFTGSVKTGCKA